MKLTVILTVLNVFTVFGTVYSQKTFLSLNAKNTTLKNVLLEIEDKTEFSFLYKADMINQDQIVNIDVKDASIDDILNELSGKIGFDYKILDNQVIVLKEMQQQTYITGIVTDQHGSPLPGVTVVVKGTTQGTITDTDGNYSLSNVPDDATLVFSFVGMKTQEIQVAGKTSINVVMAEDAIGIEEVVAIGYGEQSRARVTTSISKLDTKVLENTVISNVGSALEGTITGLRVTPTSGSPGSPLSILLRGGASISSPGSPLVVVDGVVRSINDINSSDIESINVLKDAASTAIYGARANGGVILIQTKKAKSGVSDITYKVKMGINIERDPYEYLNARDYLWFQYFGVNNTNKARAQGSVSPVSTDKQWGWGLANPDVFDLAKITDDNRSQFQSLLEDGWEWMINPMNETDTLIFKDHSGEAADLTFRDITLTQDHYLSFSGGNDKGKFAASLGYYLEDGIVLSTKYERFTGTLNGSYKIRNNFEVSGAINFSDSKKPPMIYSSNQGLNYTMKSVYPTFSPIDEDGNPNTGRGVNYGNAEYWLDKFIRKDNQRRTTLNIGANWEITPNLLLNLQGNLYFTDYRYESFDKEFKIQTAGAPDLTRNASARYFNVTQHQHTATFDYKKNLKKHYINILVGGEYFDYQDFDLQAAGRKAATDDIYTLNAATERTKTYSYINQYRILSSFGRINYNYDDRYLFTGVLRSDGISSLSGENRWGLFPGLSVGWNVHAEKFFKDSQIDKYISVLKPRISYGVNGNVAGVGNYEVQGVYSLQTPYLEESGFLNTGVVNSGLRWEKSKSFDAGVDAGILNNKIMLTLDYFRRVNSDLLTQLALPMYTGFSSFRTNLGSLLNYGFESDIKINLLKSRSGFTWDIGLNASFVKNKILKLPYNGNEKNRQGGLQVFDPNKGEVIWVGGYQEGETIGDVYGFKQERIFQDWDDVNSSAGNRYDAIAQLYGPSLYANLDNKTGKYPIEPGDVLWADLDENDIIDSRDRVKMGNIYPKLTGGLSTIFKYKNFALSTRFSYGLGHIIYAHSIAQSVGQYSGTLNNMSMVKDMWRPDNTDTDLPMYYYADIPKLNIKRSAQWRATLDNHSSRFYYKGDYLKLNEVTLSYNLPKIIVSRLNLSSVLVNLTGQNLAYITKYPGVNPELGGVDDSRYPIPRTVIFGLQVSF